MLSLLLVAILLTFAPLAATALSHQHLPKTSNKYACARPVKNPPQRVVTPPPHTYMKSADLPKSLDWRSKDGVAYARPSPNQHEPLFCGSCWAWAASTTMGDRIRIKRGVNPATGQLWQPDFEPATQTLVDCSCFGCHGGDSGVAFDWIDKHGISTTSCKTYEARGLGNTCSPASKCVTCGEDGNCTAVTEGYPNFGVEEFGSVTGVEQMKAELQRGPIACYVWSDPLIAWGFEDPAAKNFSIWKRPNPPNIQTDHVISVVGYGEEEGTPYFVIRNSWNTNWGYSGHFRIIADDQLDPLKIYSTPCNWVVPKVPQNLMKNAYILGFFVVPFRKTECREKFNEHHKHNSRRIIVFDCSVLISIEFVKIQQKISIVAQFLTLFCCSWAKKKTCGCMFDRI